MTKYLAQHKFKYVNCYKPANEHISKKDVKGTYNWYAQSYSECFWGMCDHQASSHSFVTKPNGEVITEQPQLEKHLCTNLPRENLKLYLTKNKRRGE